MGRITRGVCGRVVVRGFLNIIQLYEEKENQDCFEFLENKIRETSQQMIERIYSEEVLDFLNRTASIVDEKGF